MVLGLFKQKTDPGKLYRDGTPLFGYLNATAGKGRPAVVVVHDWFGLTPYARSLVDRFAQAGFVAFGADLYRGRAAADVDQAQALNAALPWARAEQDLRTAVLALAAREKTSRVGVVGFAMGGAASVYAATTTPEIAAVVTFYGIPKAGELAKIKAKVQGHFGNWKDPRCTPDRVRAFERALTEAQVGCEVHRYDAGNGFFNETKAQNYSAPDAATAWTRTVEFLQRALGK